MEIPRSISRIMTVSAQSSANDLDRLGATLAAAKDQVREAIQDLTGPEMEAIIAKLENGDPLNQQEKDYVRSWIIGDAESYTRVENHLQAWLQEFQALRHDVQNYEGQEVTLPNLLNLHAILEDAIRVAANIEGFLEKKERIGRFEKTIQNLENEDTGFILSILRGQLQSEDV